MKTLTLSNGVKREFKKENNKFYFKSLYDKVWYVVKNKKFIKELEGVF